MIPLLRPLPLLIKEKVEFYYYRQKWLENIKIMNKQYKQKIIKVSDDNFVMVPISSFCVICVKRTNNGNEIFMKTKNNRNFIKCTCNICGRVKMYFIGF